MHVTVVSSTFNRAALLDRALRSYSLQTLPKEDWDYVLVDDGSDDDTREVVHYYERWTDFPIRYVTAREVGAPLKAPGVWRDGSAVRNSASLLATGDVLVMTHPEIIVPETALASVVCAVQADPHAWHTAIPYWLPPVSALGDLDRAVDRLRELPGFYDPSWPTLVAAPGSIDYRNQNEERRTDWESEVFWAMSTERWRWLGGFREFTAWGSVDMDFLGRRRIAGVRTRLIADIGPTPHHQGVLMVYHPHHDSPREMDKAVASLAYPPYRTVDEMRFAGGLYDRCGLSRETR